MELILTSFGLSHLQHNGSDPFPYQRGLNGFFRMPPVSVLGNNRDYKPDYAVLLLCDRIIVDSTSFEMLSKGEYGHGYQEVANVIKNLYDEGFVRIEDFNTVVADNRVLLEQMLERDIKRLDNWIEPLTESIQIWEELSLAESNLVCPLCPSSRRPDINTGSNKISYEVFFEALRSSSKRRRSNYKHVFKEFLKGYLAYVNANLILSRSFEAGFHDWSDYAPLYREKFLNIGREGPPAQNKIDKIKRLFELSFPEFSLWDSNRLIKTLKDKRIVELRNLVDEAVREEIEFDSEFAHRILQEVIGVEQRVARLRNILSYVTLPLGFIPVAGTIVQKGVEEGVGRLIENKAKKPFRWFYLIRDLTGNPRQFALQGAEKVKGSNSMNQHRRVLKSK